MILSIVLCLTLSAEVDAGSGLAATASPVELSGAHRGVACALCHTPALPPSSDPSGREQRASGCVSCHRGYEGMFDHAMSTRDREKHFVEQSLGKVDSHFFEKNCQSCHVKSCLDCHGPDGHAIGKPSDEACLTCHKGYFVGAEYHGRAPREDHLRYKRGPEHKGETYLRMIPDVHAEAGLTCSSCHTMKSFLAGEKAAKRCLDCHEPSRQVTEHRNRAHLSQMECYACHSAWAAQEYGSFYVRLANSPRVKALFELATHLGDYVKSAYLKRQDAPPLGLNAAGKVSPIRPQFVVFFTDVADERAQGRENRLLAARWKAFFPHTIRRETVLCDRCHDNPRRFVLEREADRVHQLQRDGLELGSFWDRAGQMVVNGDFVPAERVARMAARSPAYQRAYVEKWRGIVQRVEGSSGP
jgi:hypothetical protein